MEYNFPFDKVYWPFETVNRDTEQCTDQDPNNPTNNFWIDVESSIHNIAVKQLHVGSLELPSSQYIIEEKWSNLKLDEGVPPLSVGPNGECDSIRMFSVMEKGTRHDIVLPSHLNAIDKLEETLTGGLRITTRQQHGLDVGLANWNWGSPLQLIGLPSVSFPSLLLSEENVDIIDDFTFDLFIPGLDAESIVNPPPPPPPPPSPIFEPDSGLGNLDGNGNGNGESPTFEPDSGLGNLDGTGNGNGNSTTAVSTQGTSISFPTTNAATNDTTTTGGTAVGTTGQSSNTVPSEPAATGNGNGNGNSNSNNTTTGGSAVGTTGTAVPPSSSSSTNNGSQGQAVQDPDQEEVKPPSQINPPSSSSSHETTGSTTVGSGGTSEDTVPEKPPSSTATTNTGGDAVGTGGHTNDSSSSTGGDAAVPDGNGNGQGVTTTGGSDVGIEDIAVQFEGEEDQPESGLGDTDAGIVVIGNGGAGVQFIQSDGGATTGVVFSESGVCDSECPATTPHNHRNINNDEKAKRQQMKKKQFTMSPIVTQEDPFSGAMGFLYAPSIPSPDYLASIVNAGIKRTGSKLSLVYDSKNTRFILFAPSDLYAKRMQPSILTTDLSSFMGFTMCNTRGVPLVVKSDPNDRNAGCSLAASFAYRGVGFATMTPGNYDGQYFGGELLQQLSRLYFDPGPCDAEEGAAATRTIRRKKLKQYLERMQRQQQQQQQQQQQRGGASRQMIVNEPMIFPNAIPASYSAYQLAYQHAPLAETQWGPKPPLTGDLPALCKRSTNSFFTFLTPDNRAETFPLPQGFYTPFMLANYISEMMTLADEKIVYIVEYDPRTGKYTIMSEGGESFGLEFDLGTAGEIPSALGFDRISYSGQSLYTSSKAVRVPTYPIAGYIDTNSGTNPNGPFRTGSNVYQIQNDGQRKKYVISAVKPRPIAVRVVQKSGNQLRFSSDLDEDGPTTAHGFQVGDVVSVCEGATEIEPVERKFKFPVTQVVNAFEFVAHAGSASMQIAEGTTFASATFDAQTMFNLYFGNDKGAIPNGLKNEFMGFPADTILWDPESPGRFISPHVYSLDPPKHLLLQIEGVGASSTTSHDYKGHTLTKLLGKTVLYPPYRIERMQELFMDLQGIQGVGRLRIRILNPDHTLYEMHGAEWSGTFVFMTPRVPAQLTDA